MKKVVLGLMVFFTALSCSVPSGKGDALTFDCLKVDKCIYASDDTTKLRVHLTLEFTYPVTFIDDSALNRIQRVFVEIFGGDLCAGLSPKDAFNKMEKNRTESWAETLSEDLNETWKEYGYWKDYEYWDLYKLEVVNSTAKILTVQIVSDDYGGGAHGATFTGYYNISMEDGKLLTEADLFKEGTADRLSALISEALHAKYDEKGAFSSKETIIKPNGNF
jgi:hypothetical protein